MAGVFAPASFRDLEAILFELRTRHSEYATINKEGVEYALGLPEGAL